VRHPEKRNRSKIVSLNLRLATAHDKVAVLELVRKYHEFEEITFKEKATAHALTPLLQPSDVGRIWLIERSLSLDDLRALRIRTGLRFRSFTRENSYKAYL
jgi:hypothetical protein